MTTYFPGILTNGSLVPGLAAATVRTTLELGGAALLNVGTTAGTVAAGDAASGSIATHAALTSAVHGISAFGATLIDDAAAVDARNTLGLGAADSPTFANLTASSFNFNANAKITTDGFNVNISSNFESVIMQFAGIEISRFSLNHFGLVSEATLGWSSHPSFAISGFNDVVLRRGGPGILSQRNGTNAQAFEVYKTYTSATSNERWYVDTSTAGFLDIIAGRGSLGGAENGIRIGGKLDGGSFVPWLSFTTTGAGTFSESITASQLISSNSVKALVLSNNDGTILGAPQDNIGVIRSTNAGFINLLHSTVTNSASRGAITLSNSASAWHGNFMQMAVHGSAHADASYLGVNNAGYAMLLSQGSEVTNLAIGNFNAIPLLFFTDNIVRQTISGTGDTTFIGSVTASGSIFPRAGTAAAGTSPIKLTTGVLHTTPEPGAVEYDGTNVYFTDSGGTRRQIAVVP